MTLTQSYREVPYPSLPRAETQPALVAGLATLLGLEPAPPAACRVLELGCSDGGNLLAAACLYPESSFVGIDLAPNHIAAAKLAQRELGLANVSFEAANLLEFDVAAGSFDYVFAHGMYSWVGAEVRERILTLCRQALAPAGVACVSYNTYPGWHLRSLTRDVLRFGGRHAEGGPARLAQGQRFLELLVQGSESGPSPLYHQMLSHQLKGLQDKREHYLVHEYLEDTSHPLHVQDFVSQAAAQGLVYLCDARYAMGIPETHFPDLAERLRELSRDHVELEQHLDFLTNRSFRWSLLAREGQEIKRDPQPHRLERLHLSAYLKPEGDLDLSGENPVCFVGSGGGINTELPATQVGLVALARAYPQALSWDELRSAVGEQLANPDWEAMAKDLFEAHRSGLVELHVSPLPLQVRPSERPKAHPFARLCAAQGGPVVNVRSEEVDVGDMGKLIVPLLDGTRDRAALLECLLGFGATGELVIRDRTGQPLPPEVLREVMGSALDQFLESLAFSGTLVE